MTSQIDVGRKIRELRLSLNESQADFALRFGVEQATVSRWERGEPVKRALQEPLAKLAGMSVAEFFHTTTSPRLVPIIGEASGERFETRQQRPGSHIEYVKLDNSGVELIGIRVNGDYLVPAFRNGDLLIGPKLTGGDIQKAVGEDCIVGLPKSKGVIRILRPGSKPGLYTLRSHNPREEDLVDVEVGWVAPVKTIIRQ